MYKAASVSVVVPVFNSERTLGELHERIAAALNPRGVPWELILVNDGSGDRSWDRVVGLSEANPEVRGIDLTRNFGQHNALLAGIHAARCEVIVTMDDDLQDRPEEIPRLLDALTPEVDLVYGRPFAKQRVLPRRVATRLTRGVVYALSGGSIARDIGGFRCFRASLLADLDSAQGRHLALDTPLARASSGRVAVGVEHDARRHGRSNYTFGKLVRHALTELRSVGLPNRGVVRRTPTYLVARTCGGEAVPERVE